MSEHNVYCECDACSLRGPSSDQARAARRDQFAAAALTGRLADDSNVGYADAARESVGYADALLAELDREETT